MYNSILLFDIYIYKSNIIYYIIVCLFERMYEYDEIVCNGNVVIKGFWKQKTNGYLEIKNIEKKYRNRKIEIVLYRIVNR